MRLSVDEHGPEEVARHDVYLDGELIPVQALIEANEEAFYVETYLLDNVGQRRYRSLEGDQPGQCRVKFLTEMRYGHVQIVPHGSTP